MKSLLCILLAAMMTAGLSMGQDTTQVSRQQEAAQPSKPVPQKQKPGSKRVYFVGNMALSAGPYSRRGYSQRFGGNVWLNAQVLFDVLQDERSPYRKWDPVFSVGIATGF